MLQIETLMVMVGREDTLLGRAVTLTPAPRGDQELDTAPAHDPHLYSILLFCFTLLRSIFHCIILAK